MNKKEREQREKALARSFGICPICNGSINQYGTPQYAHKIANTETFRKMYGSFIIDHTLNGEMTCSLSCNQAVNIGYDRGEVLKLITDIVMYELKNFEGESQND